MQCANISSIKIWWSFIDRMLIYEKLLFYRFIGKESDGSIEFRFISSFSHFDSSISRSLHSAEMKCWIDIKMSILDAGVFDGAKEDERFRLKFWRQEGGHPFKIQMQPCFVSFSSPQNFSKYEGVLRRPPRNFDHRFIALSGSGTASELLRILTITTHWNIFTYLLKSVSLSWTFADFQ